MSQATQQEQIGVPAKPRARRDWEWFWRIVASLMLLIIGWMGWVLYQITPRSVVTPLAYTRIKPIGGQASGTQVPTAAVAPAPAAAPARETAVADEPAKEPAQLLEPKAEQKTSTGLRLATEISTPLADKQTTLNPRATQTGDTPAATKDRP